MAGQCAEEARQPATCGFRAMGADLQPCAVLPEQVDLLSRDSASINTSGAIQRFGMLVAVDRNFTIRRVSANLSEFLPMTPAEALGRPLEDLVGEDVGVRCRMHLLTHAMGGSAESPAVLDADLPGAWVPFTLALSVAHPGLIIECEPKSHGPLEYRSALRNVAESCERLREARDPLALLQCAAQLVSAEGGFHRTLVYCLDGQHDVHIIAEVANGVEPCLLGRHFSHIDIPEQKLALYLRNRIRTIADVNDTPAPLLGLGEDVREPLDLSLVALRSVSPIHVEYLRNMGVRASFVISLIVAGRLWGMIVCHHQEPRYAHRPLRIYGDLIGQFVSLQLERQLAEQERAAVQRVVRDVQSVMARLRDADTVGSAIAQSGELLGAWEAEAFHLVLNGERLVHGRVVPETLIQAIEMALLERQPAAQPATQLAGPPIDRVIAVDSIGPLLDGLGVDPDWVAGLLFVPLGDRADDYALWLRAEHRQTITWAGPPQTAVGVAGADQPTPLSPCGSFVTWVEEVLGRSLPWTAAHRTGAERLAQVIGIHIADERKRGREREELAHRLTRYDSLTGLPNRMLLLDHLQAAITRAERQHEAFAVCSVGLSLAHPNQDQFGHAVGDEALKAIAVRLGGLLRQRDTLARVDGDALAVLIEDIPGKTQEAVRAAALIVVNKLMRALDEPVRIGSHVTPLDVSVGICCYPEIRDNPARLLHLANAARYAAGKRGCNPTFVQSIEEA